MMTNEEIYNLMDQLGMLESSDDKATCLPSEAYISDDRWFAMNCKDIVYVLNFVQDLTLNNDTNTIERFLVALLMKNAYDMPKAVKVSDTIKQSDLEEFFEGK